MKFFLLHFIEKNWDEHEDESVHKLVKLLQANEDNYARLLWEDEGKWKELWKKSKLREYKLDHFYREQKNKTKVDEASTSKTTIKKQ